MEYKTKSFALEIKQLDEDGTFSGYASTFGNVDQHRDVCVRGCFKNTINGRTKKIRMLWQHDMDNPIGVYTSMVEDENGLYVEGKLNMEVQRAREAYALLKQGAIDSMSIGYITLQDDVDQTTGIRYLKEVKLIEISLVTYPANEQAVVDAVKAAINNMQNTEQKASDRIAILFDQMKAAILSELKSLEDTDPSVSADTESGTSAVSDATDQQSESGADTKADDPLVEEDAESEDTDDETKQSLEQLLQKLLNEE